jgi:chromosome partitioning protein
MPKSKVVVAVLSRKGGVGKTTVTMNLAIASGNASVLDTDPQASAADWGDRRASESPQVMTCPPKRIKSSLEKIQSGWVFIDTQPSDSDGPVQAALAADICLIVTQPNQLDLDAVGSSLSIAAAIGKPSFVVLNLVHPSAAPTDVITLLESAGATIAPTILHDRGEYKKSPIEGLGVLESNPDSKAAQEIWNLFNWLEKQQ